MAVSFRAGEIDIKFIKTVADYLGVSTSDFIRTAALKEAEKIYEEFLKENEDKKLEGWS